ncbi:hypothetical protein CK230_29820 [Mesorhizobium sp. WSM3859]|nr:hypothetical protein CK230_29820 [Mesorhizobium sp. WSM3859]
MDAARLEAVRAAGEMINDSKQSFWEHMAPWIMNVTDDRDRLLFTLQFKSAFGTGPLHPSGALSANKKPAGRSQRPGTWANKVMMRYQAAKRLQERVACSFPRTLTLN